MSAPLADLRALFDLNRQVIVITGAGRGIGLAMARGLGAHGARIVVAELDHGRGADAAAGLIAEGIDAVSIDCDVTSAESVDHLLQETATRFGEVDVLINNAGMSARIAAEEYPAVEWDRMVALNLTGLFLCMRKTAKRWIDARRGGRIINLASFAGIVADPMSAPYAATKGGVVQLTRTCAVEWAPHGILVNAIAPGYVRTDMTAHTLDHPETGASVRARTPLGRPANPDELIGAAVYLSSRASSYVTGHVLMVDGGWTAV
ncbi:MAG: glucose 1-dehydrogenase [Candidatus Eisenbacteria bacterium]|nr:glucose 1-dehydrogenase [Candidatus Eisenbacteria bacterium]